MSGQPGAASPREPVSIQFHASLAVAATRAADCDGAGSVTEWVTRIVEQELWRRAGKCRECGAERTGT